MQTGSLSRQAMRHADRQPIPLGLAAYRQDWTTGSARMVGMKNTRGTSSNTSGLSVEAAGEPGGLRQVSCRSVRSRSRPGSWRGRHSACSGREFAGFPRHSSSFRTIADSLRTRRAADVVHKLLLLVSLLAAVCTTTPKTQNVLSKATTSTKL